jgi:hypothetical protein
MGLYEDNKVLERLDRIEVAINTLLQLAQGPTAAIPAAQALPTTGLTDANPADPANPVMASTTSGTATQQDTTQAPIGTGTESAGNTETVGSAQVGATKPE